MFQDQFDLNSSELSGLREICIFVVLFYIKAWYQAPSAVRAPQCDLTLLQQLIVYSKSNKKIAEAALAKLVRHLWYLTPETAALGFFDPDVPLEVKLKMSQVIKSKEGSGRDVKKITIPQKNTKNY